MIWIYRLSLFEFVEELWEGDSQLNWIILRKLVNFLYFKIWVFSSLNCIPFLHLFLNTKRVNGMDYNAKLSDFGASQGWTDR
ncbi:hypothetical protein Hanom_Chr02g00129431 [Helianthus anomalus]